MGPACPPSRDNITMPPNPKLSYFDASAETFPPAVIEELIRQEGRLLKHQGEILTIDCKLKPKLWGPISENLEYIRLGRRNETAQKYINKSTASYKTALISHRLANLRGEVKNRIKNILTLG